MEFSRPEYWSGLPFPAPGDLPNPGIEPGSPALQADSLPAEPPGKPLRSLKLQHLRADMGFPGSSDGKAYACNAGDLGLIPGSGRIPWRRQWQPTPVLLPGKFHGWRSLVGYSP